MSLMKQAVINRIPGYLESGVLESILRNSHMNAFSENQEDFDEGLVKELLEKLAGTSAFRPGNMSGSDVLLTLVKRAKKFRKEVELPWKTSTVDAVLVDFINYCGSTVGIDFGLYTCDIEKE